MGNDTTERVKEIANEHDVEVKFAEIRGETLYVETVGTEKSGHVASLAALLFYRFPENEFEEVALRNVESGETNSYDVYEVLGSLIPLVEDSDTVEKSL